MPRDGERRGRVKAGGTTTDNDQRVGSLQVHAMLLRQSGTGLGLQRCEAKRGVRIAVDNPVHRAVAERALPIKENDRMTQPSFVHQSCAQRRTSARAYERVSTQPRCATTGLLGVAASFESAFARAFRLLFVGDPTEPRWRPRWWRVALRWDGSAR